MNKITFVCTQLGSTDYLSWHAETTFSDLIKSIKEKYELQITKYMQKNFSNIRENLTLNDITIKLHYFNDDGDIITIGSLTKVNDIISENISRIYWNPEPIGGGTFYFKTTIC